jgi:hypothetical protein
VHLCDDCKQADIASEEANSGSDMWMVAKAKLQQVLSGSAKPQFIILLGDLPRHKTDAPTRNRDIGIVLHDVRELAQNANIPLLFVPGNNDAADENYGRFSESVYADDVQCKKCWPFIETSDDKTVDAPRIVEGSKSDLGYYSAYPTGKGLRVIVMNTVLFTHKFFKIDNNELVFATKELQWLDTQLNQAEAANEKVIIAMHVPPGEDYQGKSIWQEAPLPALGDRTIKDAFLHIVAEHAAIITGILSSHTHLDGIKLLYDDKNKPMLAGISIPAIAPGHGNYPSFNLVYYKPTTFDIVDFKTCFYPYENGQIPEGSWGNAHFYLSHFLHDKPSHSMKESLLDLYAKEPAKVYAIADSIFGMDNQKLHKHDHDKTVDVKY